MNNYKITNNEVVFDCGCSFFVINGRIQFCADLHRKNNINFECPYTYQILGEGLTQGIFQLQSPLGVQWCSKLKPENINHLSGLNSALRPGALEAKDEHNISITIHYERRKNNKEKLESFHPVIDDILKDTYGCMLFQEQSMEIAKRCAGFNLQEADILRRGIGHKEPETIAKCKKMFIEKCKETQILSEKQAEEIFGLIEASQRYQFNASLTYDTIVETHSGFKTIDELKVGDFVKSPSDDYLDENSVEVTNIFDHGKLEVYEIILESGKSIKCTLEHKFLCDDGLIRPLSDILLIGCSIMAQEE